MEFTGTRMMRSLEAQRNPGDPQAVHEANSANAPTGRYATPEEVANVVMYLCSDLSGDITGTHIVSTVAVPDQVARRQPRDADRRCSARFRL
jgi:NAD(P)-dependent dehydrogenase (short-subunit alcohol dehydrogenase family)